VQLTYLEDIDVVGDVGHAHCLADGMHGERGDANVDGANSGIGRHDGPDCSATGTVVADDKLLQAITVKSHQYHQPRGRKSN